MPATAWATAQRCSTAAAGLQRCNPYNFNEASLSLHAIGPETPYDYRAVLPKFEPALLT
jgi:hypothetical protein